MLRDYLKVEKEDRLVEQQSRHDNSQHYSSVTEWVISVSYTHLDMPVAIEGLFADILGLPSRKALNVRYYGPVSYTHLAIQRAERGRPPSPEWTG